MTRFKLFLVLAAVAVLAALALVAPALGQGSSGQEPAYKQAFEAAEQARQAAAAQGPHAARHPELVPANCVQPTPATGIFEFRFGPFFGGRNLVNYASAIASTGDHYMIYAGAPDDAPGKGLLRVMRDDGSSCGAAAGAADASNMQDYAAPGGPLAITQIAGDTVLARAADGTLVRFNYVSGQFMP